MIFSCAVRLLAVVVCCLSAGWADAVIKYHGHKVIRFTPQTTEQLTSFKQFLDGKQRLDIWRGGPKINSSMDIRLSPLQFEKWIESGFRGDVFIDDVQKLIDDQKSRSKQQNDALFDYSVYHKLDEVYAWIKNVTTMYPKMTTLFNVTNSYEGRPLMGFKISTPSIGPVAPKPAYWIESGIHAREWISVATMLYMAGQMLDSYSTDPDIKNMVDMFDWYILPVTNPDGYEYTWSKERLWRKTRSPQTAKCFGVDPNRNWDIEWCKKGASNDPCSDQYCGPSAFSEVEVKGVANMLKGLSNLKAFMDFHSYSQLWMTPWAYTKDLPKDFAAEDIGAFTAVEALKKVNGTVYEHGSIANVIDYLSSGSSADWTYGELGIKFSYGVELRDTGKYGFILPPDQILPSGKETLQAMIALSGYVHRNI